MNKSGVTCMFLGLLVFGIAIICGCYFPIRFWFFNNTGETIRVVAGEHVFEIENQRAVRSAIKSGVYDELIQKGTNIWMYDFSGLTPSLDGGKRIIFVQVERDGTLLFLRATSQFPVDGQKDSSKVLQRKYPSK